MNEFISVQVLLSLAGCVGIVIAATQVLKKYIKTDPKNIALSLSIILGLIRIIVLERFTLDGIFIGLINIFPILCGATGGYDTLVEKKGSKTIITPNGDIIPNAENIVIADIPSEVASAINSNNLSNDNILTDSTIQNANSSTATKEENETLEAINTLTTTLVSVLDSNNIVSKETEAIEKNEEKKDKIEILEKELKEIKKEIKEKGSK